MTFNRKKTGTMGHDAMTSCYDIMMSKFYFW